MKGEGGGGLKCEGLIGTLDVDVQIRYNVSSLFATGCRCDAFPEDALLSVSYNAVKCAEV